MRSGLSREMDCMGGRGEREGGRERERERGREGGKERESLRKKYKEGDGISA